MTKLNDWLFFVLFILYISFDFRTNNIFILVIFILDFVADQKDAGTSSTVKG